MSPEHPRSHTTPTPPPLEQLLTIVADPQAIAEAHKSGYNMRQIAIHLGCGVTTIHRRIRDHEQTNGTRKT